MVIFVTGGAGFIGSSLVRYLVDKKSVNVVVIDKLTYAGNLNNLKSAESKSNYFFEKADICDFKAISDLFSNYKPNAVIHLAAESHVDRSIDGPKAFIETNIIGTYNLLEAARTYLKNYKVNGFRFLHVSTDEVYGELEKENEFFTEKTPYDPHSPYSATKAASDHLVCAWGRTFEIPFFITNCSNNYGPYQFPEKLIPLMILNAIEGKPLPVYGRGENVRDWLYVEDHVEALYTVLTKGSIGETYNIGGNCPMKNIEVVKAICSVLDEAIQKKPRDIKSFSELIAYVNDRPGHDLRYAIDASKIKAELNWQPKENFKTGIEKTVRWYIESIDWCKSALKSNYNLERLGMKK